MRCVRLACGTWLGGQNSKQCQLFISSRILMYGVQEIPRIIPATRDGSATWAGDMGNDRRTANT